MKTSSFDSLHYGAALAIAGAMVVALLAWFLMQEVPYWALYKAREDGPLETLSAAGFLAATLIAMIAWFCDIRGTRARWAEAALIVFLGIACALSEISFGTRVFDIETPDMPGGGEFDGVQDIFILIRRGVEAFPLASAIVTLFVLLICWALLKRYGTFARDMGRAFLALLGSNVWAAASIALLVMATIIDVINDENLLLYEEGLELLASFYLLAASLSIGRIRGGHQRTP